MKPKIWIILSVVCLLASACIPTFGETEVPTLDSTALYRYAQETVAVSASKTVAARSPTPLVFRTATALPTQTPLPVVTSTLRPSATSLPTYTPFPSVTPLPTANPNLPDCNLAAFVEDVTVPDGTQMEAGAGFVKTWRLKNVGSCTWTKDYRLAYVSGDKLGGPDAITLPGNTAPGETVDLSISLTAPTADGKYTGVYRLQDAGGNFFGSKVSSSFGVQFTIRVGTPPAVFAVTRVNMSVDTSSATSACPPGKTFTFHAEIIANGPGTVKYHWIFSNGTNTSVVTLNYATAGPNMETMTWTLGASGALPANPYSGWARVYIDEPNHQAFSQQAFLMGCIY